MSTTAATVKICQIPGNSDIAGIGVRASVYIQACLAGFNFLYMYPAVQRRSPHLVSTAIKMPAPVSVPARGHHGRATEDVEMGVSSPRRRVTLNDRYQGSSAAVDSSSSPAKATNAVTGRASALVLADDDSGLASEDDYPHVVHRSGRSGSSPHGGEQDSVVMGSARSGSASQVSPTAVTAAPDASPEHVADSADVGTLGLVDDRSSSVGGSPRRVHSSKGSSSSNGMEDVETSPSHAGSPNRSRIIVTAPAGVADGATLPSGSPRVSESPPEGGTNIPDVKTLRHVDDLASSPSRRSRHLMQVHESEESSMGSPHLGSPLAIRNSPAPTTGAESPPPPEHNANISFVDMADAAISPVPTPATSMWESVDSLSFVYCPVWTYPFIGPERITVDMQPGVASRRSSQRALAEPWFKEAEVVEDIAFQSEYMGMIKGLERVLFMVGFAVILSALIEAKSADGLTAYHALVILNISQINNFTGLLLFISRITFRSSSISGYTRARDLCIASMPSVIHSSVMSALGLYFWMDRGRFLAYANQPSETGCQPLTYIWIFGAIEVSNPYLRVASLGFYAISAIPLLGHFLLAFLNVCMLALLIGCFMGLLNLTKLLLMPFLWFIDICILKPLYSRPFVHSFVFRFRGWHWKATTLLMTVNNPYDLLLPLASCALLCAPFIYVIVSTELTIRLNGANVESGGENRWTYGQTLALFSAIVGIVLYTHELVKIMRQSRRRMLKAETGTRSGSPASAPGESQKDILFGTAAQADEHGAMFMAAVHAQRRRRRAWSA